MTTNFQYRVATVIQRLQAAIQDPDNEITQALGIWVTRVILENTRADVIREETPWDCSTFATRTADPFDLSEYKTIDDFLKNEATGNTVATYCSGMGMLAEMYLTQFNEVALDLHTRMLKAMPEALDPEWLEGIDDAIYDQLCISNLGEHDFSQPIRAMAIEDCCEKYLSLAIADRAAEELAVAQAAANRALAQANARAIAEPVIQHLGETLSRTKWEKANWSRLLGVLKATAAVFGQNAVASAVPFLRLRTSNSVALKLRERFKPQE